MFLVRRNTYRQHVIMRSEAIRDPLFQLPIQAVFFIVPIALVKTQAYGGVGMQHALFKAEAGELRRMFRRVP